MGGADRQHPVLGEPAQVIGGGGIVQRVGRERAAHQHQRALGAAQHVRELAEVGRAGAGERARTRRVHGGIRRFVEDIFG